MVGFKDFLRTNSDALLQSGAGLLGGGTVNEQIAGGLLGFSSGLKQNKTLKWLKDNSPDLADAMENGLLSGSDAAKIFFQRKRDALESEKPRDPFMSVGGHVFNRNTQEWLSPPGGDGGGNGELGLNPIWAQDDAGNYVPLQPSKSGGFVKTTLPEGLRPLGPFGTEYDKGRGRELGKGAAEAEQQLQGARTLADTVNTNVQAIKDSSSLGNVLGPIDSRTWNILPGSTAVQSRIDQLKGSAFLQARQLLKGGGAITDFEGKKAEQAMARMDQAQSEDDFRAALDDFNSAVQDGVRKLEAQSQGGYQAPNGYNPPMGGAAPAGRTNSGASWRVK